MPREPIYDAMLARLAEPSTIVGLVSASAVLWGWKFTPEYAGAIATGISFVASVVLVWVKEQT